MNNPKEDLKLTWIVARWEFTRFYKIRNELIGMAVMIVVGVISYLVTTTAMKQPDELPRIAVIKPAGLVWNPGTDMLRKASLMTDTLTACKQLSQEQLEGVLVILSGDRWKIITPAPRKWISEIESDLKKQHNAWVINATGITTELYEQVTTQGTLERVYLRETPDRAGKITAMVFIIFILMGIFLSFAYQFTAISGEKQQRITEQIISAVKPGIWMDGKILGISLTGITSITVYGILTVLGFSLFMQLTGKGFAAVFGMIHLPSAFLFLLFALLSIVMWNAFLAAISSMITDPNNSSKNGLLMLPLLPAMTGFLALGDPDTGFMQFLSLFPLTSGSVMPARMVLGNVQTWEVITSLLILLAAIWLMRKAATLIFRTTVLITGKEPSFAEVWRWARS
ncbi:MAG TPA: hypothetical protein DCR43_00905 [Bacteroidales bacterium]|nr:MAG: hypothetical protein A2X11_14730 [Bacteroidetes bacterium GWE2_42_24]OFY31605.1 MAG: hypothetical protein A2X09_08470 [Bacteroidetes bacterium GWF2_43_11]HAQ64411.1 hypothetical protein [Bacteroidales bacterium]HBZ67139.1 hypothetical protein [Bacteroidales bacterium]